MELRRIPISGGRDGKWRWRGWDLDRVVLIRNSVVVVVVVVALCWTLLCVCLFIKVVFGYMEDWKTMKRMLVVT